jgi:phage virion morphogenesis protein
MAETEIIVDLGSTLKAVNAMGRRVENTKPLASTIAETMLSDISRHFEDEEGPGGTPWKDLAGRTKEERRKKGHWPGKKLQRQSRGSGLLGAMQARYDSRSVSVTNNKVYAAIQHFGGKAGPGKKVTIPARPYMYLSADAREEIRATVEDFIVGK